MSSIQKLSNYTVQEDIFGKEELPPDKKLILHILKLALDDLTNVNTSYRESAIEWFTEIDSSYIFSFKSVCEYLKLSDTAILEKIYKLLVIEDYNPVDKVNHM